MGIINKRDENGEKLGKTGFGKMLDKAAKFVPQLAGEAFDVVVKGESPIKAVSDLIDGLRGESENPNSNLSEEDQLALKRLVFEAEQNARKFELDVMSVRKDLYQIEVEDRKSAREREVAMVQAGKVDWMQPLVGIAVMVLFGYLVWVIINKNGVSENPLVVHLLGIIEGAIISIIAYYYGSSKGSKDKTNAMMGGKG